MAGSTTKLPLLWKERASAAEKSSQVTYVPDHQAPGTNTPSRIATGRIDKDDFPTCGPQPLWEFVSDIYIIIHSSHRIMKEQQNSFKTEAVNLK